MMKSLLSLWFFCLILFLSVLFGVRGNVFDFLAPRHLFVVLSPTAVFADDDEEEDEDEDEDDEDDKDEDDEDDEKNTETRVQESVITTYRLVTKTVTILDEKFKVDTDGDTLVDGLDPHPTVPEAAYFTDDDEDAVPNALDAYPGQDDFFVFEDEADQDQDGLLDSFVMATKE
jgi:hypothetical protein